MPPIINSEELGKITLTTKKVFVEATGTDYTTISIALNILVNALIDLGGKAYSLELDYGSKKLLSPNFTQEKRTLTLEYVNKILGTTFTLLNVSKLLTKMNYTIFSTNKKEINVLVPATRNDIWHDIDLIDDIARAYDFNKFLPCITPVSSEAQTTTNVLFKEDLSTILIGLGYQEVFTLILSSTQDQFKKMNTQETQHLHLQNTVEQSINMIRTWLTPELLKCLHHNRSVSFPQKIFEINYTVIPDSNSDVLSKDLLKLSVISSHSHATFTDIKQVLDALFIALGETYEIKPTDHTSFIPGRAGKIYFKTKEIALLGEIHPQVLENWNLETPAVALELNLTALQELLK